MAYFLFRQGITYGPYSVAEMQMFVSEGRVLLTDFARTDAMLQWQPLQAIWNQPPALPAPIAAPVPPPAPSPLTPASNMPPSHMPASHMPPPHMPPPHWPALHVPPPPAIRPHAAPVLYPGSVPPRRAEIRVAPPQAPAAPPPRPAPIAAATRGNLLSWPFHQRSWFESLWMILLWWFPLPLIPIPLGAILCIGWSVDAARRWSAKTADLLPRPQAIGRMFLDGLIVAFFFCFYFLIPVTLAWMATALSTANFVFPTLKWLWHYAQGQRGVGLEELLKNILVSYLVQRALIAGYVFLAWPIFTAAGIRFVLTREASSFFHLPACIGLLFRHFWSFLKFLTLTFMTAVAIVIADALLASTGVGIPMVVLMGAAGAWAIAYLFANLAAKVCPSVQRQLPLRHGVSVGMASGAL